MEQAQADQVQVDNRENTTEGALKYRLDTASIIDELEITLKGYRIGYDVDSKGNVVQKIEKVSEPMMNGDGIHFTIGYLKSLFNAHFFQGNMKEDTYFTFLERARLNTAKIFWKNQHAYGIKTQNLRPIQELIHRPMIGWASRPVGDKEREHLTPSIQRREIVTQGERRGSSFNILGESKNN